MGCVFSARVADGRCICGVQQTEIIEHIHLLITLHKCKSDIYNRKCWFTLMKYILINLYGFQQQHHKCLETVRTMQNVLSLTIIWIANNPKPPTLLCHVTASPSLLLLSNTVHPACVDLTFSWISKEILKILNFWKYRWQISCGYECRTGSFQGNEPETQQNNNPDESPSAFCSEAGKYKADKRAVKNMNSIYFDRCYQLILFL